MGNGAYLVVLFLGAIVVVVDGQLILRTGPAYLSEVYRVQPARKLSLLVTVFFHLVMLGVVALVASVDLGADPGAPVIVRRLGVILLLVAVGHVVAIAGLSRLRHEQQETELVEEQIHHHHDRTSGGERRADQTDGADGSDGPPRQRSPSALPPGPRASTATDPQAPRPGSTAG
jgi:hypothetical protein